MEFAVAFRVEHGEMTTLGRLAEKMRQRLVYQEVTAMLRSFVLVQTVVALVVGAAWAMRPAAIDRQLSKLVTGVDTLPPLSLTRKEPLVYAPLYDRADTPEIISEEDAAYILSRIRPRFDRKELRPNVIEHALRTWGVKATFVDPDVLSGVEMADVLTDHGKYMASWGKQVEPLLQTQEQGISIRWGRDRSASVHHDHWLASLTEAGIHLDSPVSALRPPEATAQFGPDGKMTIEHVLREAIRDFRLDERETEWTTMAFGLWLPPTHEWTGNGGRRYSFDLLADRLLRGHCEKGVCTGTHRLYSLALLLRIDEQFPETLTDETQSLVSQHLLNVKQWITESQFDDGHWSSDWSDGKDAKVNPRADTLDKQVIATGHHLEWQAIAPAKYRLTDAQNKNAFDWLLRTMREHPSHEHVLGYYTFYSHVGNAAALWRKTQPAAFWSSWVANHPEADVPQNDIATATDVTEELPINEEAANATVTTDAPVSVTTVVTPFRRKETQVTTSPVRGDAMAAEVDGESDLPVITPRASSLSRSSELISLPEIPLPASGQDESERPQIIPGE